MSDDIATNPALEDAPEVTEAHFEPENTDAGMLSPDTADTPPVDDGMEDAEYEGKAYRLPKEIKDALLRQSDYTRKTQDVAEQRKVIEAERQAVAQERQQVAQRLQADHAMLGELADIRTLDRQIAEFAKVDWTAAMQQDPAGAQQAMMRYQLLRDQRFDLAASVQQKQRERSVQEQQEIAKRVEQARRVVQADIPGWSPEYDRDLTHFLVEHTGVSPDQLLRSVAVDPRLYKLAHFAKLGFEASQKAKSVPTKPPAPAAKPVPQVGARTAPGTKDPSKMSTDEYVKWRQAGGR